MKIQVKLFNIIEDLCVIYLKKTYTLILMDDTLKINIEKDDFDIDKGFEDKQSTPKSVNFGPGADMFMNTKRKKSEADDDNLSIKLDDFDDFDDFDRKSNSDIRKDLFSSFKPSSSTPISNNIETSSIKINDEQKTTDTNFRPINLGKETAKQVNENETWDGFKKFNEIPIEPTTQITKPEMSKEEMLREKLVYLRKLEQLEQKGAQLTKHYTMESPLAEMKGEYELVMSEKAKQNSVKFQGKILMTCITGIQYLNDKFDPFDLKLDGWAEQINENIDDYEDVFAELHEKYKSKAKMAPELKLLFMLGGSAAMVHLTNTMFKSSIPGMDDILKQNPDLMNQFAQAAMSSMNEKTPNFANFMGDMMGQQQQGQSQQQRMPPMGSPQGPEIPSYQSRPDIMRSRQNDAEDARDTFGRFGENEPVMRTPARRPEMNGPRDLDDILSGLKIKSQTQQTQQTQKTQQTQNIGSRTTASFFKQTNERQPERQETKTIHLNNDKDKQSIISIDELMEISKDADGMPKKTHKKPKSERTIVSLDI